jgi:PAS domain S-box-containing protein
LLNLQHLPKISGAEEAIQGISPDSPLTPEDHDEHRGAAMSIPTNEEGAPADGAGSFQEGFPLTQAEQRLRSVLESILAGIVLVDEAGIITMVNRQTEVIFGYSRDELCGQPIEILVPAPLRQAHRRHVEAYFRNPRPREMTTSRDILGLRKDGRTIHLQVALNPIRLDERLFVLASLLDVTDQQRVSTLLTSVVEFSPDGAIMVDHDGRIVLVNRETERLFGYSREELLGQAIEILVPEEVRDRHRRFCLQFLAERRQRSMKEEGTLHARRKDGSLFPVDIAIHSYDLNGEGFAIATIRDMSEHRRLLVAVETNLLFQNVINRILQTSLEPISLEEHLRRTLDLILPVPCFAQQGVGGVFLAEGDTLVLKAQRNLPPEVLKHCGTVPFGHCLCGRAAVHRELVFAECLDERHDFRYPCQPDHGHYCVPILAEDRLYGVINVYLNDAHHPRRSEEEKFLSSVAGVLAGTIERKRGEEALRRSEERFDLAVRGTDAGVWDWDLRTGAVYFSPRWKSMLGYADDEVTNAFAAWESLLHPEEHEWALTTLRDYLEGRSAEYELEHRLRHKDGSYRWILSRGAAVRDHEGRPYRMVGSHLDITAHKQTVDQLNEHRVQLRAAEKIQQALLPKRAPTLTGLDLAGVSYPAAFAGGDMFDYLSMFGGKLGVVIGDVSGHGIASALQMASTLAFLRSLAQTCATIGEIMTRLNRFVFEQIDNEAFVTLLLLQLDPRNRTLLYANAGHPCGYVLDALGQVRAELSSSTLPLGILEDLDCPVGNPLVLQPGDLVVLLTDGILEAQSPEGICFGRDRVLEVIRAARTASSQVILEELRRAISRHSQTDVPRDDLTAVVIKNER